MSVVDRDSVDTDESDLVLLADNTGRGDQSLWPALVLRVFSVRNLKVQ